MNLIAIQRQQGNMRPRKIKYLPLAIIFRYIYYSFVVNAIILPEMTRVQLILTLFNDSIVKSIWLWAEKIQQWIQWCWRNTPLLNCMQLLVIQIRFHIRFKFIKMKWTQFPIIGSIFPLNLSTGWMQNYSKNQNEK